MNTFVNSIPVTTSCRIILGPRPGHEFWHADLNVDIQSKKISYTNPDLKISCDLFRRRLYV